MEHRHQYVRRDVMNTGVQLVTKTRMTAATTRAKNTSTIAVVICCLSPSMLFVNG